ncbi:MAG TPA: phosphoenolpyruvate synthase, partial [Spirochaetota bacterium]|nr:phosphoenolpyruvate synthase [Spirochaetota bacterium]
MDTINKASTGLPCLDKIVNNLIMGDNVVWQVDTIADYKTFVDPFVSKALSEGRNLNYIRFAEFPPLLFEQPGIKIHYLNAHEGFESFSKRIYTIINREGENAYYIFDSLSELQSAWATDLM